MKKWILVAVLGVFLVGGWYVAKQQVFLPNFAQPKFGEVSRGDIKVPITASGLIHAERVIEVKSEASGKILDVPVQEGDRVQEGSQLVLLDPEDEERMRDRAKANLDRAEALLTQATVAVDRAQVAISTAEAHLKEVTAQAKMSEFDAEKVRKTLDSQGYSKTYSPEEVVDVLAQDDIVQAQLEAAGVAVESAKLQKKDAEAAVVSQQATVESARKEWEDAVARCEDTTVLASQEAVVTQVYVKPGMLVQSATQGFTGGTPLMTLADDSRKHVVARVDEADYGRVLDIAPIEALPDLRGLKEAARSDAEQMAKRSGVVRVTVDAFPDEQFEGRISRVEPQGKLNAGSSIIQFDVMVEIVDPEGRLPLGAQAQVEFTIESALNTLRVPAEAVKAREDQRGVYVQAPPEPGSREKYGEKFVPCRFGISDGEYTELVGVLEGELPVGTKVYTKRPTKLDEE
jgi:HlyD family secretion protein